MRRPRSLLSLALLLALVVGVLAACGSGNDTTATGSGDGKASADAGDDDSRDGADDGDDEGDESTTTEADDDASTTTESTPKKTTTTGSGGDDDTTTTVGSDDSSTTVSVPEGGDPEEYCALYKSYDEKFADSGSDVPDEELIEAIRSLAPVAPPELRDDIELLAGYFEKFLTLTDEQMSDPAFLEQLIDPNEMEALEGASAAMEEYTAATCGIEP